MTKDAWLAPLTSRHAARGLIIDTNVLLLLLVGLYDESFVSHFKRTRMYTPEDFRIVKEFASYFRQIVVTPHILAELSNLSLQMKEDRLGPYFSCLTQVLKAARETPISKDVLLQDETLPRFGFTDLSIASASSQHRTLVLTDDFRLFGLLSGRNGNVINFNHLRQLRWSG